jgi:hypothetical protein
MLSDPAILMPHAPINVGAYGNKQETGFVRRAQRADSGMRSDPGGGARRPIRIVIGLPAVQS